ncbi:MAG TPA: alpha/beta hydrolase [Candidatus Hydrogenedentes bacterium]|nr:alpha/beta hydrolase [Candidatus Hydrogenedentota bacterium]
MNIRQAWAHILLGIPVAALLLAGCSRCPESPGTFRVLGDIPYAEIPGTDPNLLRLDLYLPDPAPKGSVPLVVWVHGGGWSIGDKSNAMDCKASLLTGAGYALASVNYRLSPRIPSDDPGRIMHPVHAQDVATAVFWLREHAPEYGFDPGRIALMGHSAGAHLVSIVATDASLLGAHGLTPENLAGIVSLDTEGYDVAAHMSNGPASGIYQNAFGEDPALWAAASPITHVAAGRGIPPFLIVTRGSAFRKGLSRKFADSLEDAEISATVVDAGRYSHADVNRKLGMPGETVVTPPVMAFLEGCLR